MSEQQRLCDICPSSKCAINQTAVFYCDEDEQNFCLSCATIHQRFNSTSKHTMQCLLPQNTQVPCLHQSEQRFYCQTHKVICCEPCRTHSHSNCEDKVVTTEEFLKEKQNLISRSEEMLRHLKRTKNEFEKHAVEKENKSINRMQKAFEEMNKAKEELEEKVNKRVEYMKGIVKKRREHIEKRQDDLQKAMINIKAMRKSLCDASDASDDQIDKIVNLKEGLEKYEWLLGADSDESHMAFLKMVEHDFEAKHYVSASLQKFQESVKSLNTIYIQVQKDIHSASDVTEGATGTTEQITHETQLKSQYLDRPDMGRSLSAPQESGLVIKDQRHRTQLETANQEIRSHHKSDKTSTSALERFRKYSSKSLEEYMQVLGKKERDSAASIPIQAKCQMNIRSDTDKAPCGITGIVKLSDGYLLMADYENSKLKLYAPCGDFKAELICNEKPRDMTKVEDKFIVNFPTAKKIHFVKVETDSSTNERKICLGKKIETNGKCCGIASNENKIYIATQIPHQILIMNTDGKLEKTIPGDKLFERATYIAVDPLTSIIYISDPNDKVILGISEDMEKKFQYHVERPHGIVCAGGGMIFVADWNWDSETIHLVNKDGERVGALKVENCYCPQKLMFCADSNTLVVTQWQKDELTTVYLRDSTFTH